MLPVYELCLPPERGKLRNEESVFQLEARHNGALGEKGVLIMKTETYLSRLVLSLALLVSALVFIAFPIALEKTSGDEIAMPTIRHTLEASGRLLPIPTKYAMIFADHKAARIVIFGLFAVAGVLLERSGRSKAVTGTYHSVCLILFIMMGAFFSLGCILPYIPC